MARAPFLLALTMAAGCAPVIAAAPHRAPGLPADVARFIERRDQCDHLRGEDGYDAARAAELERKLRAMCKGTDAELARLKRTHARDVRARAALAGYDPAIE